MWSHSYTKGPEQPRRYRRKASLKRNGKWTHLKKNLGYGEIRPCKKVWWSFSQVSIHDSAFWLCVEHVFGHQENHQNKWNRFVSGSGQASQVSSPESSCRIHWNNRMEILCRGWDAIWEWMISNAKCWFVVTEPYHTMLYWQYPRATLTLCI